MKNRGPLGTIVKIALFILAIFLIYVAVTTPLDGEKNYTARTGFIKCEGYDALYYDPVEKVVYVIFNEVAGNRGYGYMSPYYASDGSLYSWDPTTYQLIPIN